MPFFSYRRPLAIVVLAAMAMTCTTVFAQDAQDIAQAEYMADQWLRKADEGQYAAVWDASAPVLQATVSRAQWVDTMNAVRAPLGAVLQRTRRSSSFMRELQGMPEGDYVVIQYETVFENKTKSVETITPQRYRNGRWRVAGYYIQ